MIAAIRDTPTTPIVRSRPKGVRRTEALARALREMDITFDVILSSPFVRARETAEIVERGLRLQGRLALTEHLVPGGDVEKLVR